MADREEVRAAMIGALCDVFGADEVEANLAAEPTTTSANSTAKPPNTSW